MSWTSAGTGLGGERIGPVAVPQPPSEGLHEELEHYSLMIHHDAINHKQIHMKEREGDLQSIHVKLLNSLVRGQASHPERPERPEPGSQKQGGREGDGWKSHESNPVPCLSDWHDCHDWHASLLSLHLFFSAAICVLHADYDGFRSRLEKEQRTQESLNFSYEWANSDCQQAFLPTCFWSASTSRGQQQGWQQRSAKLGCP